ncbi:hypothetical protein MMC30_009282 [Trapelia coarctata]|nr:hypothetical protein [Trapelia coarctata]
MPSPSFFVEDLAALREEPSIHGIVESTWRDLTTNGGPSSISDWVSHNGVPQRVRSQYNREGRCPRGYVIINYIQPYSGYSLISEKSLLLLDRGLLFGDVVKKQSSNTASGTVIRSSVVCTLRPIYSGIRFGDNILWPHKEEDNILRHIPGRDIRFVEDYQNGDLVIYRDWVGEVEDVSEELTVRLGNGSVVVLTNLNDVEVPGPPPYKPSFESPLPQILARQLDRTLDTCVSADSVHAEVFHPGQLITTTKANLRLGRWVYGQYDPSVSPCGTIVEVSIREINVHWKCRNPFSAQLGQINTPPSTLDRGDFEEVRLYERGRSPLEASPGSGLGPVHGSNIAAGDYVRFRDVAGAALKYSSEDGVHGIFRRVSRLATQGYEVNVFLVTKTETHVLVQWQDGTTSEAEATSLVPYLNVDEHDLWPGEIVYEGEEERAPSIAPRTLVAKRIGVVQWTDARDRLARVRWFADPKVSVVSDPVPTLLPGSCLGELSTNETTVSLYEIFAHPVLSKRRGDMTIIAPGPILSSKQVEAGSVGPNLSLTNSGSQVTSDVPSQLEDPLPSSMSISPLAKDGWIGEIVDLGLEGLLTVRLGLANEVHDVQVPIESVVAHVNGDYEPDEEPEEYPDEDFDYSDEEAYWDELDSDGVVIETVEYDGGTRLDADSGDEMWTTDDENGESLPDAPATPKTSADAPPRNQQPIKSNPPPLRQQEYKFTAYKCMPSQFELLDESVPSDHHFSKESTTLTAAMMRRIRQEHSILESSLPEGIWVRAWGDNISLLRVLLVGAPGTPYSLAPFVLDLHFGSEFPSSPPKAYFYSWTNRHGRINPNLYEDGTVCLSLLGTWPGVEQHEEWNADSSVLQILVSLMGLVLVKEPFYNEAGFEAFVNNPDTHVNSALYTEKALVMAKGFVNHAISHEISGLTGIIEWLYCDKEDAPQLLRQVIAECDDLLNDNTTLSSGAKLLLKRHVEVMRNFHAKLDENGGVESQ